MTTVRRLDRNHDWTFGQGLNNYATTSESVAQRVQTHLWSFLGDWFLDLEHGLPWLEKMGRNVDLPQLELMIKRCVLSTDGVREITDYQVNLDETNRALTVRITYQDIYQRTQMAEYRSN